MMNIRPPDYVNDTTVECPSRFRMHLTETIDWLKDWLLFTAAAFILGAVLYWVWP